MAESEFPEDAIGDMDIDNPEDAAAEGLRPRFPFYPRASGMYARSYSIRPRPFPEIPRPIPFAKADEDGDEALSDAELSEEAEAGLYPWFQREELRVDVDGWYPQMTVSGTIRHGIRMRIHWIANVRRTGRNTYAGDIWYKDGNTSFLPHTRVKVVVQRSWFPNQRIATAVFSGGGVRARVRRFGWRSSYFHPVDFEFDREENITAQTVINTCDHPNRPAGLTCENLSAQTVFRRAGFDAKTSRSGQPVPIGGAGANTTWSDAELHDAMQAFWSDWSSSAQWSLWTFFGRQHDIGSGLGGIMFDDIGPNHRQGTAIFTDSFISNAPAGDAAPNAWVRRMHFWTAVHEMGHAFNLAHSWQKALGSPWIPLANEPEARSFMNYPYNVSGGQTQFFSDFDYRFSDQELMFMRHAPARFVQMGNADWFDDHGFEQARISPEAPLQLEARVHRHGNRHYEFMEPISIELKLKNVSGEPALVEKHLLSEADHLTVIVKRKGRPARQWAPYANRCYEQTKVALDSGKAMYGSLRISSGLNGWDLAEPGLYQIQVAMHHGEEDLVSNPLMVQVAPPMDREEELLAQDYFSDDVGRILAMDGSLYLDRGNDVLREVCEKMPKRNAALSARLALAMPRTHRYRLLNLKEDCMGARALDESIGKFKVVKADRKEGLNEIVNLLDEETVRTADVLGHIEYKRMVDMVSHVYAEDGDNASAAACQDGMQRFLDKRGVLSEVLDEVAKQAAHYKKARKTKPSAA